MPDAILGSTFTFQVLYVDGAGDPIVGITDAAIEIFTLDGTGTKTIHASGSMSDPVPPETGRFVFPYLLNTAIHNVGDTLYAEYTATDPISFDTLRKNETLGIVSEGSAGEGLRSRFIE